MNIFLKKTGLRRSIYQIAAAIESLLPVHSPSARLVWCPPTATGLSKTDSRRAFLIKRIIESCPSLSHPDYIPPLGMGRRGRWSNMGVQSLKLQFHPRGKYRRQEILCPDGGMVSIDWADDDVTRKLPSNAPIMIGVHTVFGEIFSDELII